VEFIMPTARLCERICIDYTGPGVGFGDIMAKELGLYDPKNHQYGKVQLCTFTAGFKREIFPRLKTSIDKLNWELPVDVWFREDLHSMAQINRGTEYTYEAPRTKIGHADACTALALTELAAASQATNGGGMIITRESNPHAFAGSFSGSVQGSCTPFGNQF
jgi:hypothetical protein